MAKRFTDTEKWKDPWFRKLHPEHKIFWIYLYENCDIAGYWKIDYEMATFICGFELNDSILFKINEEKKRVFKEGAYLRIGDFISFQYGHLSPDCRPHRPVIELLNKYEKKGYQKGIERVEEQEQDKDQEKERKGGVGEKQKYGEDGLVMLTVAQFEKLVARLGEKRTHEYIQRLENYIGSKGKRYKSHYHTILNWLGNDDKTAGSRQEKLKKQLEEIDYDQGRISEGDRAIRGSLPENGI